MNTLLPLFTEAYQYWLTNSEVGQVHLRALLEELGQLSEPQQIKANVPPVVRQHLGQAAEGHTIPELADLVSTLQRVVSQLDWVTVPLDYVGEAFANNFAFAPLAGPAVFTTNSTMYRSDKIFIGFSLQAPHTFYPAHKHYALEFYGVLSGTALWQVGDGEWQAKPPGSFIFHDSEVIHAMQTQEDPLLTTFAWIGDIYSPPEMVYKQRHHES